MRRLLLLMTWCVALAACTTTRPSLTLVGWDQRLFTLQKLNAWQLEGRAAVAVGTQGWQASLNWHQAGLTTQVHLAGPLGIGAITLEKTPDGLSLNGAPASDAMVAQLQDRLGFALPLDELRYWLLGVPEPKSVFELVRNDQDRAKQLVQANWTVDYDRYMAVGGDLLPAHLVLSREGVRVRIAVDHWEGVK